MISIVTKQSSDIKGIASVKNNGKLRHDRIDRDSIWTFLIRIQVLRDGLRTSTFEAFNESLDDNTDDGADEKCTKANECADNHTTQGHYILGLFQFHPPVYSLCRSRFTSSRNETSSAASV